MIDRQRIVTYGIPTTAAATVALALWLKPWAHRHDPHAAAARRPRPSATAIDVVFAVDTTGSMGGLLDGAKRTVWSIANHITRHRSATPTCTSVSSRIATSATSTSRRTSR